MFEAETKFKNKLLTKQLAVYRLRMAKYGRIMSNSEKITNDLNLELWKNGSHSLLSHEVFPVRLLQDHLDWCQIHSLQEPRSTLLSTFSTKSRCFCALSTSITLWVDDWRWIFTVEDRAIPGEIPSFLKHTLFQPFGISLFFCLWISKSFGSHSCHVEKSLSYGIDLLLSYLNRKFTSLRLRGGSCSHSSSLSSVGISHLKPAQ